MQKACDLNVLLAPTRMICGPAGRRPSPTRSPARTVPIVNKFDDHPWWLGVPGRIPSGELDLLRPVVYNGGEREFKNRPRRRSRYDIKAYAAEGLGQVPDRPRNVRRGGRSSTPPETMRTTSDKIKYMPVPTRLRSPFHLRQRPDRLLLDERRPDGLLPQPAAGLLRDVVRQGQLSSTAPTSWVRFNLNYLYIGDTTKGTRERSPAESPVDRCTKVVNSRAAPSTDSG